MKLNRKRKLFTHMVMKPIPLRTNEAGSVLVAHSSLIVLLIISVVVPSSVRHVVHAMATSQSPLFKPPGSESDSK